VKLFRLSLRDWPAANLRSSAEWARKAVGLIRRAIGHVPAPDDGAAPYGSSHSMASTSAGVAPERRERVRRFAPSASNRPGPVLMGWFCLQKAGFPDEKKPGGDTGQGGKTDRLFNSCCG